MVDPVAFLKRLTSLDKDNVADKVSAWPLVGTVAAAAVAAIVVVDIMQQCVLLLLQFLL